MKGILLSGGSGTRLYPLTKVVSKQLMPIYDKPMVYYPLSCLLLAGVKEILVISTPNDLPLFKRLLGDGAQWGVRLYYETQPKPEGLAQALIIGEDFLDGSPCCLILGDNIFYGHDLSKKLRKATEIKEGALIFAHYVREPSRYGVIEFDKDGNVLNIEEKPSVPKSNYVVPGIYFYDKEAPLMAKQLKPSKRGELEITDLNSEYLKKGQLKAEFLGRGVAWLDAGTHATLLQASNFIRAIIERQGLQVGCLEEIAFRMGFINKEQILASAEEYSKTEYGEYIKKIAGGDINY